MPLANQGYYEYIGKLLREGEKWKNEIYFR